MTLIELLVAFGAFILMVGALVSLTTTSLEMWSEGEARKDAYSRAQIVLDAIAEDLVNAYSEGEVFRSGDVVLQDPRFAGDFDANGRPRLAFVRTGRAAAAGAEPAAVPKTSPPARYASFWEVAYVMDPDPAKHILWRGARAFDRIPQSSLVAPGALDKSGRVTQSPQFRVFDTGILHVGYKFWTQFTNTWSDALIRKGAPTATSPSGAETRWDSSRRYDRDFYFRRQRFDPETPDYVYPEIVQVTVIVEATTTGAQGLRVAEACDPSTATIRLNDTRGLPDAPGVVKIGTEWIEYGDMSLTELLKCRRGRMGSKAQPHAAQDVVHFGRTFTLDVRIPAYREASQP
jgi:hypothetical protein